MTDRTLNGKLALCLLGGLAGLALGAFLLHGLQVSRQARLLREQVRQAEEQGEAERAAGLLQRYLAFAPEDADARAHFGDLQERLAQTPYQRVRAAGVYAQVLARQPDRADVRRRLALLDLELDRIDEARQHLEKLLAAQPGQSDLEGLLGLCLELSGDAKGAAAAYRKSLDHDPRQRDVAVHLARLLHGPLDEPRKAARVMDDLVKADQGSAEAYLARALFRRDIGALDDAAADMARARERAPDDPRVLLAAADLAGRRGRTEEAREELRRARHLAPADPATHLALASVEARAGHLREAADALREGLKAIPENADLLMALAEVLLDRGEQPEAKAIIARLRAPLAQAARADYLEGVRRMRRGEWAQAAQALEGVAQQDDKALAARAAVALSECWAHLGDDDRRLEAARQAVALDPSLGMARLALAAALQASSRSEEALEQYRQATLVPQPTDETWALLARALIQRNQAMPDQARNWAEVEKALARVPTAPRAAATAAVARAEMLEARGQTDQARQVLEKAREADSDQVGPWVALAAVAAHQGDARGAAGVLAAARTRLGDRPELRAAEVDFVPQVGRETFAHLRALEERTPTGTPAEQERFLCRVAAAWFEAGERGEGERLCKRLAARPAADLGARIALLEVVLEGGLDYLAGNLVADLRRLEGEDGTWWRYGEAAWQVLRAERGDRAGLESARGLLEDLAKRRPEWSRVLLVRAHLAELSGEPARAAEDYRRAFDLGDRQPGVVQRLVRLLVEGGRDADADKVLHQAQQQALWAPMARLAAEVALRLHNTERAAEMARRAVSPTSKDYRDHLWLGQVLGLARKADDADKALRQAVDLAGDLPDTWVALVAHLARADKVAEAEEGLKAMEKRLPRDQAELALAVCHEALAHAAEADRHYREALRERPNDGIVLQRAAGFWVRLDRPAEAVPLLRRLLDRAVAVPDVNRLWARRQLALALAFDGDEAKYREAQDLLRSDTTDDPAGQRVHDFVAAARPQTRADALRRLEVSMKAVLPTVEELFRLACLYETDNDQERARQVMLDVLARDVNNPEYLAHFAGSLLKRGKKDEARPWVVRLEKLEPDSPRVKRLREALGPPPVRTGPMRGKTP